MDLYGIQKLHETGMNPSICPIILLLVLYLFV